MHVSPILHHTTLSEKNWYATLLLVPILVLLVLKDSNVFVKYAILKHEPVEPHFSQLTQSREFTGSKLSDFTYAVKYRYAYIKFFSYWIFWFVDG